jgi:xanthine dehydrogenase accessory factor
MRAAELHAKIAELTLQGVPFVLATITQVTGSSPRGVGAKMLVLADGSIVETIGGGALERQVIADALSCMATGESRSERYELREKGDKALGTLCGGEATVFLDVHAPARVLLIVGAGHVGQKLAALGKLLDYQVIVLDPRRDMVTEDRFPYADQLVHGDPANTSDLVPISATTHVVIVTHGHLYDTDALRSVIGSPAASIGMIGSATKVQKIRAQLLAEGIPEDRLDAVHAPIGLDIGAETPAELALCIMAEIVADGCGKLDGRDAVPVPRAGEGR